MDITKIADGLRLIADGLDSETTEKPAKSTKTGDKKEKAGKKEKEKKSPVVEEAEIMKAVRDAVVASNRDTVKEIIAEFGVEKAGLIPDDKKAEFVKKLIAVVTDKAKEAK